MNLSTYRRRSGYGKRVHWSRNAVAAKARLRIERAQAEEEAPASTWKAPKLPRLNFVTISLQCGADRRTFRVHRYDAKRFLALGKVQAASTIGRRIAIVLEAML